MADWEAVCQYFLVPPWSSNKCGCPLCDASRQNMHRCRTAPSIYLGYTVIVSGWRVQCGDDGGRDNERV
eukprot:3923204-Pyramimonas_sp.AAC.1